MDNNTTFFEMQPEIWNSLRFFLFSQSTRLESASFMAPIYKFAASRKKTWVIGTKSEKEFKKDLQAAMHAKPYRSDQAILISGNA